MKKIYEQPKLTVNVFTTENILSSSGEVFDKAFFGEEDPLIISVK